MRLSDFQVDHDDFVVTVLEKPIAFYARSAWDPKAKKFIADVDHRA